jgi:multidrug efflux pump subunit AcrA (membrane-fusion protein)
VTLTGRIEAQEEVRLAFRVGQRMIERKVNVGDRVAPGQLVARLESTTLENAVQGAQANLAAAQAAATDARLELERQQSLLERGVAPRARVERAQKARDVATRRSSPRPAATAQERRTYRSSGPAGASRRSEPGEVVVAGQMIVRVAARAVATQCRRAGAVKTQWQHGSCGGRVAGLDPNVGDRACSAAAGGSVTRTFEVRLTHRPTEAMAGLHRQRFDPSRRRARIAIPASALRPRRQAAVWIVDVPPAPCRSGTSSAPFRVATSRSARGSPEASS